MVDLSLVTDFHMIKSSCS